MAVDDRARNLAAAGRVVISIWNGDPDFPIPT
jgi:hypothetical protein